MLVLTCFWLTIERFPQAQAKAIILQKLMQDGLVEVISKKWRYRYVVHVADVLAYKNGQVWVILVRLLLRAQSGHLVVFYLS